MRALTTLGLGLLIWCVSASNAHACSCVKPDVDGAYAEATAVFVGEVTEVTEPVTTDQTRPPAERLYRVMLTVIQAWKGVRFLDVIMPEVMVLSDQGRGGCFSWGTFVKNKQYLVYARKTRNGKLAVLFSCNRTTELADASEDLKQLDRLHSPFFRFDPQHTPRSQRF